MGDDQILLVEDNPAARSLAYRILISLGYGVTVAANAEEAISAIDTGQQFDVLFTDIVMPGTYDGLQLAQIVQHRCPGIKILFTSGFSEMSPDLVNSLGAVYMTKPYRKAEVASILRSLIDR